MSRVTVKEAKRDADNKVFLPRPIPVEALRYTEANRNELVSFIGSRAAVTYDSEFPRILIVRTPGSTTRLHPGNWLLCNGKSFSSFDDASFRAAYEPAPKK